MNILILHSIDDFENDRNTSVAYATALERYTGLGRFVYHHIAHDVTDELRSIPFDVVWLDVTFLCWRWVRPREQFNRIRDRFRWVGELEAHCIAFPQDDYDHTDNLDQWLVELGTNCIYTCFPERATMLYPATLAAGATVVPSLTGFIDDTQIETYARLNRPLAERALDVGYRVRRIGPQYGRFGILKSEFGRAFSAAASGQLATDISDDPAATLLGEAWPAFLGNCRYVLGCEGGVSVMDRTGELRDTVDAFVSAHPDADWEEIYSACVGSDREIEPLTAISPRIFEIAMAGACPILIEGHYGGYLMPDQHYVPVHRDLSNLPSVVDRLKDLDMAAEIAANVRHALLDDSRLRYNTWARGIAEQVLVALAERPTKPNLTRPGNSQVHHSAQPQHLAAVTERAAQTLGRKSAVEQLLTTHYRKLLSRQMAKHNKAMSLFDAEIKRLHAKYGDEITRLQSAVSNYGDEIRRLHSIYGDEIKRLNSVYGDEIKRLNSTHGEEIKRLNSAHAEAIARQK